MTKCGDLSKDCESFHQAGLLLGFLRGGRGLGIAVAALQGGPHEEAEEEAATGPEDDGDDEETDRGGVEDDEAEKDVEGDHPEAP